MRVFQLLLLVAPAVAFVQPVTRWTGRALYSAEIGGAGEPAAVPIARIQFYEGRDEPDIPDVKLTRSKNGQSGVAT